VAIGLLGFAAMAPPKADAVDVVLLPAPSGGTSIVLTDPSGVNNRVNVSRSNDGLHFFITDIAGIPDPLPLGCTRGDAHSADCTAVGTTGVTANLGAGRDLFSPFGLGLPLPLTAQGGPGNDTIIGGEGADKIKGGTCGDTITGQAGRDLLIGQSGNDRLAGGREIDKLNCGKGKRDEGFGGPAPDKISGCEQTD
jgi:Ca2+-binding RTX toxin-like protein